MQQPLKIPIKTRRKNGALLETNQSNNKQTRGQLLVNKAGWVGKRLSLIVGENIDQNPNNRILTILSVNSKISHEISPTNKSQRINLQIHEAKKKPIER
jgi:hypothetical protein